MSPNVSSFVGDLVEMAKAFEELPNVQAALAESEFHRESLSVAVQKREESILSLKAEIEKLNEKVRTTEVERDDAEMRFLELEEKAGKVDAIMHSILSDADRVVTMLFPPKPEPLPALTEGQSANNPTANTTDDQPVSAHSDAENTDTVRAESEPLPTSAQAAQTGTTPEPEAFASKSWSERYKDLNYMSIPGYISRAEWLEGGGTDESYDHR